MPMYKRSMFILLLLASVVIGGTLYGYHEKDLPLELDAATQEGAKKSNAAVDGITVYVSGAVNSPGVIKLDAGARVLDAVNLCGGILPTADESKVNMAQVLKDGVQIRVPEKAIAESAPGKAQEKVDGKVNINMADSKALDSLPGIGPAMAQRIVDYRQTEGAFQTLEDLKKVRGIGDAKFTKLKDKITL
ncbi:MAG: helix-hairpin-helix domain-containing protein [Selenomonadaceae bacterium]